MSMNTFHVTGLFMYPLKISEIQKFYYDVLKESSGMKWVNKKIIFCELQSPKNICLHNWILKAYRQGPQKTRKKFKTSFKN